MDWIETFVYGEKSVDQALKLLEIQYTAFRAFESYLLTIATLLFGVMAYLWKELPSKKPITHGECQMVCVNNQVNIVKLSYHFQ